MVYRIGGLKGLSHKTKEYLAIHHSIGLSLRIVCPPFKIKFSKGPVYKLHMKFTAFTEHLPLKVLDFSQVEFFVQRTWKVAGSQRKLV